MEKSGSQPPSFPEQIAEFSVKEPIVRGEPNWANYSKGIAAMLLRAGIPLVGMDAMLSNTLPVGGGLSSSAALEVGTGRALACAGRATTWIAGVWLCSASRPSTNMRWCPCGIMDQTIVAARKGRPCDAAGLPRSVEDSLFPINADDLRVVIVNSMVKHELSGGEYAERRQQCEAGCGFLPQDKALRDVTMPQVIAAEKDLSRIVFKRCRHVVGEIARTTEAARLLIAKEYDRVGELMVESHNSLRDDYEVSTQELDFLVENR